MITYKYKEGFQMETSQKLRLLTLKEAAEYLRMHKGSLYRLLESGKIDIPAIKLGGKWLFNLDSLNQYLMKKEQHRN
jgi:excisionase family DNA binding protein